jgi:hypothetical protein
MNVNGFSLDANIELEIDGEPYPVERLSEQTGIPIEKFGAVFFGDESFNSADREAIAVVI